jgi:molecular chaperone GrpE
VSDSDAKPAAGQDSADSNAGAAASVPPAVGSEAAASVPPAAEQEPWRAELEKAQADASKYKDQLLRTAADFDNFRKRARKEVEEAQRKGVEKALLELLPVADNLERAVAASQGATDVQSILEGVRMVLRFHEDALGRLGVERVPSVGTAFDPSLHEAVQQVASESPPGTVVTELAPGYRYQGKLLRAAIVAVSALRATPEASSESSDGGSDGVAEAPQN